MTGSSATPGFPGGPGGPGNPAGPGAPRRPFVPSLPLGPWMYCPHSSCKRAYITTLSRFGPLSVTQRRGSESVFPDVADNERAKTGLRTSLSEDTSSKEDTNQRIQALS